MIKLHWRFNSPTPIFSPALPADPRGLLRGEGALGQAAAEDVHDVPGLANLLVRLGVGLPRLSLLGPRGQVSIDYPLDAEVYRPVVSRPR